MNYALDSDIISELIKDNKSVKTKIQKAILSGSEICINAINYYEVKRGFLELTSPKRLNIFNEFCKGIEIITLDDIRIFDQAADIYEYLRKHGKPIGDADILIGSVALINDLTLVTNNIKHFSRIAGLKVENWLDDDSNE